MRLSILDDYQGVALDMADWSAVKGRGVEECAVCLAPERSV